MVQESWIRNGKQYFEDSGAKRQKAAWVSDTVSATDTIYLDCYTREKLISILLNPLLLLDFFVRPNSNMKVCKYHGINGNQTKDRFES